MNNRARRIIQRAMRDFKRHAASRANIVLESDIRKYSTPHWIFELTNRGNISQAEYDHFRAKRDIERVDKHGRVIG